MTTNDHKQMAQALVKAWELLAEHHREMLSHENAGSCPVCHGPKSNRISGLLGLIDAAWKAKDFLREHEVPAQSGWQPIETAPKDGSWVLLRGPSSCLGVPWTVVEGYYHVRGWKFCSSTQFFESDSQPTHWMLLPS